jgi:hypothetical protein
VFEPERLSKPDRRSAAHGHERFRALIGKNARGALDDVRRHVHARLVEHRRLEGFERRRHLVHESPARP